MIRSLYIDTSHKVEIVMQDKVRDRVEGAYYTSSIPFCIGSLTLVLFYT